jgi:hypothetical protein
VRVTHTGSLPASVMRYASAVVANAAAQRLSVVQSLAWEARQIP